jgi:NhaA family Na+:H+ antiporter
VTLKIFLLAIAIFDDIGAILVIALFYSQSFDLAWLLFGGLMLMLLYGLGRARVTRLWAYVIPGAMLALALDQGGIHATLGGVLTGLFVPVATPGTEHAKGPAERALHGLHPWVSFGVLPLFAFVSAGVALDGDAGLSHLLDPLPLGIVLALFFGKQVGIFGATWLAVRSGLARLPAGTNWAGVYAVSIVAGIGFTMSLFIGFLAFSDPAIQEIVKLGVMAGSLLAVVWGAIWIGVFARKNLQPAAAE